MANQLQHSNSPYLLQHADNPVDWLPWGSKALRRAREENTPIFLSIGYAACHWCHVMAHESFEDPETAAYMNDHFINIKVDREERPDLDAIYMKAVVAMSGQGGWPLSVFLTPDGKPFYGGTYFPPRPRHQLPSFLQVLHTVVKLWEEEPERLLGSGEQITAHMAPTAASAPQAAEGSLNEAELNDIVSTLQNSYDWANGGWGPAPKFPQAMVIDFLLTQAVEGNQMAEELALDALTAMRQGGMYDLIGGGFSRYSVDERWLIPHFEKMLYDNALLSRAYLHAYLLSGEEDYRQVAVETLDFAARELLDDQGGFYSSLDADSEGEEGKYYLWSAQELQSLFENPNHSSVLKAAFSLPEQGNFEGKIILQRKNSPAEIAANNPFTREEVDQIYNDIRNTLFQQRETRVRPDTDDKVLVSWNGLMLTAFAEAARVLDRKEYLRIAIRNADFLLSSLRDDSGRLLRSWRQGRAAHLAYLEDYASLILGLLALYQSDPHTRWFAAAWELSQEMVALFYQPDGGFFDTGEDHPQLIFRPQEIQDNATPAGSSLAVTALHIINGFRLNFEWQEIAEDVLFSQRDYLLRAPLGFGQWLQAANLSIRGLEELALISSPDDPGMTAFREVINRSFRPRTITAAGAPPFSPNDPELLQDRARLDDNVTAYLCRDFVCRTPVTDPDALQKQLEEG